MSLQLVTVARAEPREYQIDQMILLSTSSKARCRVELFRTHFVSRLESPHGHTPIFQTGSTSLLRETISKPSLTCQRASGIDVASPQNIYPSEQRSPSTYMAAQRPNYSLTSAVSTRTHELQGNRTEMCSVNLTVASA